METLLLLLNRRKHRAFRRDLIAFFEALSLYLGAGYDLSYSWAQILTQIKESLAPEMGRLLAGEENRMGALLKGLTQGYPIAKHRVWFAVLAELYEQGAPLTEAVQAMAAGLRAEQARDWEAFARTLPTKANLVLLVCFLPPTLVLLFLPLVMTLDSL
jgi:hypothetical protein